MVKSVFQILQRHRLLPLFVVDGNFISARTAADSELENF
jgi:hypothetical protein